MADLHPGERIDASKVTIVSVGFPVREPMLASGEVDAITGFSFSSYINLKDRGVPANDITVLLIADFGISEVGINVTLISVVSGGRVCTGSGVPVGDINKKAVASVKPAAANKLRSPTLRLHPGVAVSSI